MTAKYFPIIKGSLIVNHLLDADPVMSLSRLLVSCNNLSLQEENGKVKFIDCVKNKKNSYGSSSLSFNSLLIAKFTFQISHLLVVSLTWSLRLQVFLKLYVKCLPLDVGKI